MRVSIKKNLKLSYFSNYLKVENFFDMKLKYSSNCVLGPQLNFFAAEYDMSGQLVRFERFDISKLQLCNLVSNLAKTASANESPLTLTYLEQSCSVSLSTLFELADSNERFYELFFEYGNSTNSKLLPMPVKILDYRSIETDAFVNRAPNENTHQLQKRFFLYDTITTRGPSNARSSHIRYVKPQLFLFFFFLHILHLLY